MSRWCENDGKPRWARRTTVLVLGVSADELTVAGRASDIVSDARRGDRVVGEASLSATVSSDQTLRALVVVPTACTRQTLTGRSVVRGFRRTLMESMPDEARRRTLVYALLDDLPGATIISGYTRLRSEGSRPGRTHRGDIAHGVERVNLCAGWADGGTMIRSLQAGHGLPVAVGPLALDAEGAGDPAAWHQIDRLAPGMMRRRRLLYVTLDHAIRVVARLRDTYADNAGNETVLHEYTVRAVVEPESRSILQCVATPGALPAQECPSAAASAQHLAGKTISEVSSVVQEHLRGPSTCTHLNDVLRTLADIDAFGPLASGDRID